MKQWKGREEGEGRRREEHTSEEEGRRGRREVERGKKETEEKWEPKLGGKKMNRVKGREGKAGGKEK